MLRILLLLLPLVFLFSCRPDAPAEIVNPDARLAALEFLEDKQSISFDAVVDYHVKLDTGNWLIHNSGTYVAGNSACFSYDYVYRYEDDFALIRDGDERIRLDHSNGSVTHYDNLGWRDEYYDDAQSREVTTSPMRILDRAEWELRLEVQDTAVYVIRRYNFVDSAGSDSSAKYAYINKASRLLDSVVTRVYVDDELAQHVTVSFSNYRFDDVDSIRYELPDHYLRKDANVIDSLRSAHYEDRTGSVLSFTATDPSGQLFKSADVKSRAVYLFTYPAAHNNEDPDELAAIARKLDASAPIYYVDPVSTAADIKASFDRADHGMIPLRISPKAVFREAGISQFMTFVLVGPGGVIEYVQEGSVDHRKWREDGEHDQY